MNRAGAAPRWIVGGLLAADVAFAAVYAAMIHAGITAERAFRIFDLNRESNPPTWFSSSQLLLVALVFFVLACRPFAEHPKVRRLRGGILGLGVLFTYLSLDEGGVVHERLTDLFGARWYEPALQGRGLVVLTLGVLAAAVLVFAVARYALPAARIWPGQMAVFVAGCALIVAGGIVSEVVVHTLRLHLSAMGTFVEIGLEEFAEMVGASLAVFASATMLAEVGRDILALVAPADSAASAGLTGALGSVERAEERAE